jgi:hypothetical protein
MKKEFIPLGDRIRKTIPPIKISALIAGVKKPEIMVAEKNIETAAINHPRNVPLTRSKKKKKLRNRMVPATVRRKNSNPRPGAPLGNFENNLCSFKHLLYFVCLETKHSFNRIQFFM